MSISISSLTFESHASPNPASDLLGIGESTPRISWKFSGDAQNWTQEKYELAIKPDSNGAGKGEEYGNYVVESAQSVLVPWPAAPLKSGEGAVVKVRCSGKGCESRWSV
jgi:alpha-L-rhamnosidase